MSDAELERTTSEAHAKRERSDAESKASYLCTRDSTWLEFNRTLAPAKAEW